MRIIAGIGDPVVIEKILIHLDSKAVEPPAIRLPPCRRRPSGGCSTEPDDPTMMTRGCDTSGAATVAAGLWADATANSARANPWPG